MSCCKCGDSLGTLLRIDGHMRNICSLPFDSIDKEIHPQCAGLVLCSGCGNHWIRREPCTCNPIVNAIKCDSVSTRSI